MPASRHFLILAALLTFMPASASAEQTTRCGTVGSMTNKPAPQTGDPIIDREIFHISGDPDTGLSAGYDLTNQHVIGRPVCHYEIGGLEILATIDVYRMAPDQPLLLHMLCPHCKARGLDQAIHVRGQQKQIAYDPWVTPPPFPGWHRGVMAKRFPAKPGFGVAGGTLDVATPFRCTWEIDPAHRVRGADAICDFKVVIERNVIRRA